MSKKVLDEAFKNGLIVERVGRGNAVIKVMPALNVPVETLETGLRILADAVRTVLAK